MKARESYVELPAKVENFSIISFVSHYFRILGLYKEVLIL